MLVCKKISFMTIPFVFVRVKDAEMAAAEESHHQQIKTLQHRIKNILGQHEDSIAHIQVHQMHLETPF